MQIKTRSILKITLVVAASYVAYRGIRSFLRNEITLSITEVVQLPASDRIIEIDERTQVKGEIQCETYLMRSYRFLMKLSANINGASLASNMNLRSRHRVMHATESGSYRNINNSLLNKKQEAFPTINIENVHCMIDYWELIPTGGISFTPACIGDELLLRYEGSVKENHSINAVIRNCYLQSDDTPGLKRLSFDFVVYNVIHAARVRIQLPNRYCDVCAIHTGGVGKIYQPNLQKPHHFVWEIGTVDATTYKCVNAQGPDVLPEAKLARRGFTDDDLAAALERSQIINNNNINNNNNNNNNRFGGGSHHNTMVNTYNLPDTSEARFEDRSMNNFNINHSYNNRNNNNNNNEEEEEEEEDGFVNDNVGNDEESGNGGKLRRISSGLPDGTHLLIAHFILIFEEPEGVEYDYVSSESEVNDDEDDIGEINESSRRRGNINNNNNNSKKSSQMSGNISRKSAKREERARKKRMKFISMDNILTSGKGVNTRVPAVELSYSVIGLASGITVRKLQTISERANWVPYSILDKYILRWLMPGIQQLRLGKYAHYTTWFVQPVGVSSL